MKKTWFAFAVLLLSLPMWGSAQSLNVRLQGFGEVEGNVRVAIFKASEGFPDDEYAFQKKEFRVTNLTQTVTFPSVPKGKYAVAVYHDADKNGRLNKNFFGMPTEDYGFSNDATGSFGPPDYDDCTFYFDGKSKTITINVD